MVLYELLAHPTAELQDLDAYPLPDGLSRLYNDSLNREQGKDEWSNTTAVAQYGSRFLKPKLRVNSFQLFRDGEPADFIKRKDELSNYTIVLNGETFPPGAVVSVMFESNLMAEIVRFTPNQIEATLPAGKIKQVGIINI